MNEKDINEKISAWFEPKPTAPMYEEPYASPKGVWVEMFERGKKHWQPLDYFHSEDANARLLEAMPDPMLFKRGIVSNLMLWECRAQCLRAEACQHKDRKAAIVLAFCRFAKIEVTP